MPQTSLIPALRQAGISSTQQLNRIFPALKHSFIKFSGFDSMIISAMIICYVMSGLQSREATEKDLNKPAGIHDSLLCTLPS